MSDGSLPNSEGGGEISDVLRVVHAFFGSSETDPDELLGGILREWATLVGVVPWHSRFEFSRTLERAEIIELTPDHAVVDVHAQFGAQSKRGSLAYHYRADGPVRLESVDGTWQLVDFVLGGRKRSQSIVLGPLAEQDQAGACIRVMGFDRGSLATSFVIEVSDTGAGGVRVANAYALVEADAMWSKLTVASREALPDGTSRSMYLVSDHPIDLSEKLMAVALDVRSNSGRLPFVVKVPVEQPETVVPQPAPHRLPQLRGSFPRTLIVYAAITAGIAWWYGWFALLVPIYVALNVYWQVRRVGRLPARLDPVRYLVDTAVVAGVFLVLWETPAVDLAVPFLVGTAFYLVLLPLGPRRQQFRFVGGLAVSVAWLVLLGSPTGPLSPCQITDGSPAVVADSFAHALFVGHLDVARRYESPPMLEALEVSLARGYVSLNPSAAVRSRRSVSASDPDCAYQREGAGAVACYSYSPLGSMAARGSLFVAVRCEYRAWRVASWF